MTNAEYLEYCLANDACQDCGISWEDCECHHDVEDAAACGCFYYSVADERTRKSLEDQGDEYEEDITF